MLGVVFWSSLRFGLKPLALWGICCWHDTPGREMEQLRVLLVAPGRWLQVAGWLVSAGMLI